MAKQLKRVLFAICIFLGYCGQSFADAASERSQKTSAALQWSEPRACLQIDNFYVSYCAHDLYEMAMGHLRAGLYANAIMRFNQILSMKEYSLVYGNRGIAYAALGDLQKARADIERTTTMNPGLHESWYNLARIDIREKRSSLALEHINRAIDLSPEVAEYHEIRATLYKRLGKKKLAEADTRVVKMIHDRETKKDDDAGRIAEHTKE